ncbi:DUF4129 domain-containing protein [Thermococcus sp.]
MKREHVTAITLLLLLLMALAVSHLGPGGGLGRVAKDIASGPDKQPKDFHLGDKGNGGSPPYSNFTFSPTMLKTYCPVALLPRDPGLVCAKVPAKSVPIHYGQDYQLVVWFRGFYSLVVSEGPADLKVISGINGNAPIKAVKPLLITTYNRNTSVLFKVENYGYGNVTVHFGIPGRLRILKKTTTFIYYSYDFRATKEYRPGYYPFFVLSSKNGRHYALLSWVALLRKPRVEITSWPSSVKGNGDMNIEVTGRVYFDNGSPAPPGQVVLKVAKSKNSTEKVSIGVGPVKNGAFKVSAVIPAAMAAGRYQLIAYYKSTMAYPSNSDPVLVVKRIPVISVVNSTTSGNSTILRVRLNWRGVGIPGNLTVFEGGKAIERVQTDRKGYAVVRFGGVKGKLTLKYSGSTYYEPATLTVNLPIVLRPGKAKGTAGGHETKGSSKRLLFLTLLPMGVLATAYAVLRFRRKGEVVMDPKGLEPAAGNVEIKLKPPRNVFMPGECFEVLLNGEHALKLDGKPIGVGKTFRLCLDEGFHRLSAGEKEEVVWVCGPREGIQRLYETSLIPLLPGGSSGAWSMTPYEVLSLLRDRGFPKEALLRATELFIKARYSNHPVTEDDFAEFAAIIEGLRGDESAGK